MLPAKRKLQMKLHTRSYTRIRRAGGNREAFESGRQGAAGASKHAASKAAAPRLIQPLAIPKDAVEYEPGSFRATDAAGKKWIYRKTPFGVARLEDKPVIAPPDPPRRW